MRERLTETIGLTVAIGLCLAACAGPAPPPAPVVQAAPPPVAVAAVTPPKASNESLTIVFPSSSVALSPDALSKLDGAARLYRDAQPSVMIVSGQSDTQGAEFPNLILSARRANAVKQALVDRGVPSAKLQMVALGEAEPTPNISPNRAVVVTWR